jgi:hypothetical protein
MAKDLTDAEVERLMTEGSRAELDGAIEMLIEKKLAIEAQLQRSRVDMVDHRQRLIDAGSSSYEAQMEATGLSHPDWRRRATGAIRHVDTAISRLRSRIRTLSETPKKMIRTTVIEGASAHEVARYIQTLVDAEQIEHVLSAFSFKDAVVLIYRASETEVR